MQCYFNEVSVGSTAPENQYWQRYPSATGAGKPGAALADLQLSRSSAIVAVIREKQAQQPTKIYEGKIPSKVQIKNYHFLTLSYM